MAKSSKVRADGWNIGYIPKVVGTPENRTAARNTEADNTSKQQSTRKCKRGHCGEESRSFAQKGDRSPLRNEKQENLFCTQIMAKAMWKTVTSASLMDADERTSAI